MIAPGTSDDDLLPRLGLRLGGVDRNRVEIAAGTLLDRGVPKQLALIPVVEHERRRASRRYRLQRAPASQDCAPPCAADIDTCIQRVCAASAGADAGNRRRTELARGHFSVANVPRSLWSDADGVLVLLLYAEQTQRSNAEIAASIAALLERDDLERCVVPSVAVAQAEANGGRSETSEFTEPSEFCFAMGSCQFTPGMVDGTPLREVLAGPADHSYARLAQRLRDVDGERRPQLLILAGDQVYVDATAGLFDPSTADGRFRRPYEQFCSSPIVQDVRRQLQICMLLDDHEIEDNFENDDPRASDLLALGRASYLEFQRCVGPLPRPQNPSVALQCGRVRARCACSFDQGLWCAVNLRGYEFFFVDSRTERGKRTATNVAREHMLGRKQLSALLKWLARDNPDGRPRFVISPSIFLPRRLTTLEHPASALHSDAWDGYPRTQRLILRWLTRRRVSDVVFLSGDEHRCCFVTAVDGSPEPVTLRSVHCSGMYSPFPFANSIPEDFACQETFEASLSPLAPCAGPGSAGRSQLSAASAPRRWTVTSEFYPAGQGFGVFRIRPDAHAFHVEIGFDLDFPGSHRVCFALPRR